MDKPNSTPPNLLHIVDVIESPSPQDVLEDRREGYALVSALRLAQVPVRYFAVSNRETLRQSLSTIAGTPASRRHILNPQFSENRVVGGRLAEHTIFIPSVHLSAHGNEKGIALTDGTLVSWVELAELLDELNKIKGYIGTEKQRGMSALSLSCCKGLYAKQMLRDDKPWPVFAIIGSEQNIPWADALTAWVTFYHLFITKNMIVDVAIERMNLAAGHEGLFKIHKE
jgi:hypothetical protein